MFWRKRVNKRIGRKARLAAVKRESDRALIDLIRRRLALPPGRRTHFLRTSVVFRGTAL